MAKHEPSDVRRGQILQAALEVCARKGYHAARIDDIAAAAGLSKGAVYHHFQSKQDVFLGLMEQMIYEAAEMIVQLEKRGSSTAHTLRESTQFFVDMVEQQPELTRGMMELFTLGLREPPFRERFAGYYDRLTAAYAQVIEHGIERGEVRADINAYAVARAFITSGDGAIFIHTVLEQLPQGVAAIRTLTETLLQAILVTE